MQIRRRGEGTTSDCRNESSDESLILAQEENAARAERERELTDDERNLRLVCMPM
jgi:hypothetical protein